MHFVGMKAVVLGDKKIMVSVDGGNQVEVYATVPLTFEGIMTIISCVAAVVLVSLAVTLISIRDLKSEGFIWGADNTRIIKVAIGLAVSVGVMHYLGMWAQAGHFEMIWSPGIIVASVILAVIVCYVGLKILFTQRIVSSVQNQMLTAVIIGIAVSSVHYTGQQSASYKFRQNGYRDTTVKLWYDDFGSVYFVLALGIIKFFLGLWLHSYDRYIKLTAFDLLEKELYDRCLLKIRYGDSTREGSPIMSFCDSPMASHSQWGQKPSTQSPRAPPRANSSMGPKKGAEIGNTLVRESTSPKQTQCDIAIMSPNRNVKNVPEKDIDSKAGLMIPSPARGIKSAGVTPDPSPRGAPCKPSPAPLSSPNRGGEWDKNMSNSTRDSRKPNLRISINVKSGGKEEKSPSISVPRAKSEGFAAKQQSVDSSFDECATPRTASKGLLKVVEVEPDYSIDIMTLINIYKKQKKLLMRQIPHFREARWIHDAELKTRILASLPSKTVMEQTHGWKKEQKRMKDKRRKEIEAQRRARRGSRWSSRRGSRTGSRLQSKTNLESKVKVSNAKSIRASLSVRGSGADNKVAESIGESFGALISFERYALDANAKICVFTDRL